MNKKEFLDKLFTKEPKGQMNTVYVQLLKMYHKNDIKTFNNNTIYNILIKNLDLDEKIASSSRSRVSNDLLKAGRIKSIGVRGGFKSFEICDPEDLTTIINTKDKTAQKLINKLKEVEALELSIIKSKIKKNDKKRLMKHCSNIKIQLFEDKKEYKSLSGKNLLNKRLSNIIVDSCMTFNEFALLVKESTK